MTKALRETSYRRITKILRSPEIEDRLGLKGANLVPISEDVHYLRCGEGLIVYIVNGALAHMHGALLPGDGKHAGSMCDEHFAYLRALGVTKVTTRHRADHTRASIMCRALGFAPVPCDEGFKRYEKVIHGR